jgi:hypothetical protein
MRVRLTGDSGRVEVGEAAGKIGARIAFGNAEIDYAIEVHENLAENGEAKFLESVLNDEIDQVGSKLARRIALTSATPTR